MPTETIVLSKAKPKFSFIS